MEGRPVSVWWRSDVLKALDRVAEEEDVSRSKLVNRIVEASPEVKKFVSSSVVAGLGLAALTLLYMVGWAVSLASTVS